MEKTLYQNTYQIAGTKAHEKVDEKKYSSSKHILMSLDVFCEKYKIAGKIDIFDIKTGCLTERKKKIKSIYDGYIFQLYGQYFALQEMGYNVKKFQLYSMDDNKTHSILLPENNPVMLSKFEQTIEKMRNFDMTIFTQSNPAKCQNCIYEPACDRGLI